jgi:hypothetical protein
MALPMYSQTDKLLKVCQGFVGQTIRLAATFMGKEIPISNTNLVGDLLEDCFWPHFKEALPDFEEGPLQDPPDFWAEKRSFGFELKAFAKTPGFDVAPFASLVDQLEADGGVLKKLFQTKYLIFEYAIQDAQIHIKAFHYKNLWDLPNYTNSRPMSMQIKRSVWYNIRSGAVSGWSDETKTPRLFVKQLLSCIDQCPHIQDKQTKKDRIQKQLDAILGEQKG